MQKGRSGFVVLCVALLLGVFMGEAGALTLFDDKLVISGYVKNETALRLEDRTWSDSLTGLTNAELESGEFSRCRSTLWVEFDWLLTESLRFKNIVRGYYEAKYELDSDLPDSAAFSDIDDWKGMPRGENMEENFDIRESYLAFRKGAITIKAGRQQVVWGEADNLRMADIINPLDVSWNYVFPTWEEIRIPLRMINIIYTVPESEHNYQVELVLNPEDFRPGAISPYGDNWHVTGNGSWLPAFFPVSGSLQSVSGAVEQAMKDGLPERHSLRNFQGGARLRGVFGAWDTYLYYYHQRAQSAIFTTCPVNVPVFGNFDPFAPNFGIEAHYPWIDTVGATFNVYEVNTGTVFRGECGYTFNKPYSIFDQTGFFGSRYIDEDTFAFMLGFDRPTWMRFLNPDKTVFVSGQVFQTFIFGLDDDNYTPLTQIGEDGDDDVSTILTLSMDTEYLDAVIKPFVVAVWDVDGRNGFVSPKIGWEPSYEWRLELGARFLWGKSFDSGAFGLVKNNDEVWLSLCYKF